MAYKEKIKSKKSNALYSEKSLQIGAKLEKKEHNIPLKFAQKIAKDHLKEDKKYYQKYTK